MKMFINRFAGVAIVGSLVLLFIPSDEDPVIQFMVIKASLSLSLLESSLQNN